MARWEVFELTTVQTDLTQLAAATADLLFRRIADPTVDTARVVLPARLVLRGTHATATAAF
jgi:DNA-binding LacI/PurR family transcriptional regulator